MRNDQQAVLEDGTLATPVCPHSPSDYLLFITSSYRDDPLRGHSNISRPLSLYLNCTWMTVQLLLKMVHHQEHYADLDLSP
jgi:hypothetical protein